LCSSYNLAWFTVAAGTWIAISILCTLAVGFGVLPRAEKSLFFVCVSIAEERTEFKVVNSPHARTRV
jgi:hypothetical protein